MRVIFIACWIGAIAFNVGAQKVSPNTAPATATKDGGAVGKLHTGQKTPKPKQANQPKPPILTCDKGAPCFVVIEPQTKSKEEQGKDASLDLLYRRYMCATIIGVAGGLIGVLVLIWQTVLTRTSANAARLNAQAVIDSERSWLLINKVGNPVDGWRFGTVVSQQGYAPGIVFQFMCYGNSPARIMQSAFIIELVAVKKGEPDLPEIPDYTKSVPTAAIPRDGMVIPTRTSFEARPNLVMTVTELEELNAGTKILCAYGFIKYDDVFGRNRETRVCYVYYVPRGGVATSPDGTVLNPEGFRVGGPSQYNTVS